MSSKINCYREDKEIDHEKIIDAVEAYKVGIISKGELENLLLCHLHISYDNPILIGSHCGG